MTGSDGSLSHSFIFGKIEIAVKRYITEIPLTFDVSDECSVYWRVKYETYAANVADAETTARIFVLDMRKKLGESMTNCVSREMYN